MMRMKSDFSSYINMILDITGQAGLSDGSCALNYSKYKSILVHSLIYRNIRGGRDLCDFLSINSNPYVLWTKILVSKYDPLWMLL